jgi:hypothetical protein
MTFGRDPVGQYRWYNAWLVIGVSVVAGVVARFALENNYHRAYLIYGVMFLFGIVVPGVLLLAVKREVGFTSLFVTIMNLRSSDRVVSAVVSVALTAGLAILLIHLAFYPWPSK